MSRAWVGAAFVQVVSAEDGQSHLIAFAVFEQGLAAGDGRYVASCGKKMLAASMSDEPGRSCNLCRAAMNAGRKLGR